MSIPDRRAKLDREHGVLSIRRQCRPLGLSTAFTSLLLQCSSLLAQG
jgi:hypothetical protein